MKNGDGAKDIRSVLRKHLGQRTVLGVAVPVLADHVDAAKRGATTDGLTERQIEAGFRKTLAKFISSEYHSTYIDRRLGARGFLEFSNGRYRLRQSLVEGIDIQDLEVLRAELVESLRSAYEQRQTAIKQLEKVCSLPKECVTERFALVDEYLSQLTGNRGEIFEVVSFAVLREYFRTFGFSLQRFSTTHANDGGMDFVAGDAIYQVTTDESAQKVRRDLAKAPGTKRVLVRPTVTPEISELFKGDVLEAIELKDLLNHFIAWLLERDTRAKQSKHLQRVLEVALEEFRREDRAAMTVG
ncbi:MAG: hypothetical protein WA477_15935 [Candidatus Sulfotelmatobacter sp.]